MGNLRSIDDYKSYLTTERISMVDPLKGKQSFKNLWASCHYLYGREGNITPELTGSKRTHVAFF